MMADKFRIVMTDNGRGKVWRNGELVESVVSVKFEAGVGEINRVTLSFLASEVEIEAEALESHE